MVGRGSRQCAAAVLGGAILLIGGCAAQEHIPIYPAMADQDALAKLAAQARAVRSVSGQGDVTLTRAGGDSVRLDAAMVMEQPGKVRLRAWKLSRAMFDLTVNDEGMFLAAPRESGLGEKVKSAGIGAGQFARMWTEFSGEFFERKDLRVVKESPLTVVADIGGGNRGPRVLECEVDRRTLTPRVYRLKDAGDKERFRLELSRYVDHGGGIVYPHRMLAVSQGGKVEIELRDVEVNGEVAGEAFRPPARAEKLP